MKTHKMLLVTLALVVLAMSNLACGSTEVEDVTVDAVVEHQSEVIENGVECEYMFISTDINVRLAHYRVCKDDDSDKRMAALQSAIDDCVKVCAENADCLAQCSE